MTYTLEQIAEELYKEFEIIHCDKKTTDELKNESFEDVSRVHDWRNYVIFSSSAWGVSSKAINEWQSLSDIQRLIRYCQAIVDANNENWD